MTERPSFDELRRKFGGASEAWTKRYAGRPGTGPAGQTCGSCAFLRSTDPQGRGRHPKCGKFPYTAGDATTIKKRSPACHLFQLAER